MLAFAGGPTPKSLDMIRKLCKHEATDVCINTERR